MTIQDARLKKFIIDSNEALEFRLIRGNEDLESEEAAFKPEMSHQVFGSMYVVMTLKNIYFPSILNSFRFYEL